MTRKLYLSDSYLWETAAKVLEVREAAEGFDVVLDRTVLFPTSGGQPGDRGWIDGQPVQDVRLEGNQVVHRLAHKPTTDWVDCQVDGEARLDAMQQHSGQHLLSRILLDQFGAPTVAFHLGTARCTIDVIPDENKPLTEDVLTQAERMANALVQKGLPIRISVPTQPEIERAPADLGALAAGQLRIIDMHGLDRSFCCGTHLQSTAEIGPIKVLGFERKGRELRLEFVCGQRSLQHHESLHRWMTQLSRRSSARPEELNGYLDGLLSASEAKGRQIKAMQTELARLRAESLATKATEIQGRKLVHWVQEGGTPEELRVLAEELSTKHACAFVGGVVPETGDKGSLLIAATSGSGWAAGKLLGEVLGRVGGRGGGRPEMAQGGAPAARIVEAVELAVAEIHNRWTAGSPG